MKIYILVLLRKSDVFTNSLLAFLESVQRGYNFNIYVHHNEYTDVQGLSSKYLHSIFNEVKFVATEKNESISCVYNSYVKYVLNSSNREFSDLALFFDEDSCPDESYFKSLNILTDSRDSLLAVPLFFHINKQISPIKKWFGFFPFPCNPQAELSSHGVYFINSGMAFKVSYLRKCGDLVDTGLLFYGTDTYISRNYYKCVDKIIVLPVKIIHSFFMYECVDYSIAKPRFKQIINSFKIVYADESKFAIAIRVFLCRLKFAFRFKSISPLIDKF